MYHRLNIHGFSLDSLSQRPLVLLKDGDGKITLPLWLNKLDVLAIVAELLGRELLTQGGRQDLLGSFLKQIGMDVSSVTIDSADEGLYAAAVRFEGGREGIIMQVRPSEAIVAAMRFNLPIMVAEEVVSQTSVMDLQDERLQKEATTQRLVEFLENLDPATLGKYPM